MRISDWSSDVCSSDLDEGTVAPSGFIALAQQRIEQLFRILPFTRNTQRNSVATQDFRIARPAVQRQFIFPLRPFRIARQVQRQAPVGRNVGVLDAKASRTLHVTHSPRRPEERRVGNERVRTGRSRWWP